MTEVVTEIQRFIGIMKNTFQKLNKVIWNWKMFLGTKKISLDYFVISNLLFKTEY